MIYKKATAVPVPTSLISKSAKLVAYLLMLAVGFYFAGCTSPTDNETNPPAAPANLTTSAISSTTVELTWEDNSYDEEGFGIERKTGEEWEVAGTVGVDTETFTDTTLSPETSYTYRVSAFNSDGVSAYSNESTVITPAANQGFDWGFVSIPAGSFEMGSPDDEEGRRGDEGPVHTVTFATGFKMLATEITQGMWKQVMGEDNNPSFWRGDNLPVEQVDWDETQEFLAELNLLDPGKDYRLPSEAEWEYACRAGTTTRFYWGDDPDYSLEGDYAWFFGNFDEETHLVGTKLPNAWGLYDMCGNVWEWCEDDTHGDYTGAPTDGSAWIDDPRAEERTWRGGSIRSWSENCRSASRGGFGPGLGSGWRGFRIVCNDD